MRKTNRDVLMDLIHSGTDAQWSAAYDHLSAVENERDDLRSRVKELEGIDRRAAGGVTDTERLDWLEGEFERELLAAGAYPYTALFRQNAPITREAIDSAICHEREKGADRG